MACTVPLSTSLVPVTGSWELICGEEEGGVLVGSFLQRVFRFGEHSSTTNSPLWQRSHGTHLLFDKKFSWKDNNIKTVAEEPQFKTKNCKWTTWYLHMRK